MAAQTLLYSGRPMNPTVKHLLSLIGRILLVILLSTAVGWAWFYLLFQTAILGFVLIKPAVVIVAGIASGFCSRFLLRKNTFLLRWLTALLALFSGMLFMNYGSTGLVGFEVGRFSSVNWNGLWQFTLGGCMATIAMAAWRKPVQVIAAASPQDPRDTIVAPAQAVSPSVPVSRAVSGQRNSAKTKKTTSAKPGSVIKKNPVGTTKPKARKTTSKTRPNGDGNQLERQAEAIKDKLINAARSLNSESPMQVGGPVVQVRVPASARVKQQRPVSAIAKVRPQKRHKSKISLVGTEEHRCPFCLEDVDPQDPAGVVVCPICHTYHHKSCWDITGTCQVPHSQSS